jgi:hypothetical protein
MQLYTKHISYSFGGSYAWFRVGPAFFSAKSLDHWPMSFSERNGYVKKVVLFGWLFKMQKDA